MSQKPSPDLIVVPVPAFSTLGNAAFALRRAVFVLEQRVPPEVENDHYDLTATHFVALAEGEVAGTLRLVTLPEHVKIGRVAVHPHFRSRGIARAMMRAAMAQSRAQGQHRFYLSAQSDKLAFYQSLGFVAFGPEFTEGGMPHRAMRDYDKETADAVD